MKSNILYLLCICIYYLHNESQNDSCRNYHDMECSLEDIPRISRKCRRSHYNRQNICEFQHDHDHTYRFKEHLCFQTDYYDFSRTCLKCHWQECKSPLQENGDLYKVPFILIAFLVNFVKIGHTMFESIRGPILSCRTHTGEFWSLCFIWMWPLIELWVRKIFPQEYMHEFDQSNDIPKHFYMKSIKNVCPLSLNEICALYEKLTLTGTSNVRFKTDVFYSSPLSNAISSTGRNQECWQTITVAPVLNSTHYASDNYLPNYSVRTLDLHKEKVRLCTYITFPSSTPVFTFRLAQAGFYYTGERDEVKCFCCGVVRQGWTQGEKPQAIHAAISPECPFVRGRDSSNIPLPPSMTTAPDFSLSSNLNEYGARATYARLEDGSATPQLWPQQSERPSYSIFAASSQEGSPRHSHQTMPLVPGEERRDEVAAASADSSFSGYEASSSVLCSRQKYVGQGQESVRPEYLPTINASYARYPLYCSEQERRRSFRSMKRWPDNMPDVEELVQVGFFYAGYADCVRCFYCGLGLKSWDSQDDPATCHAQFNPSCDHLRTLKGNEFVEAVFKQHTFGSTSLSTSQSTSQCTSQSTSQSTSLSTSQSTSLFTRLSSGQSASLSAGQSLSTQQSSHGQNPMPPTAQLSYAIAAMNTQFTNTLTSEQPVSNTEDGQESNAIPTPRHRTQIFGVLCLINVRLAPLEESDDSNDLDV